MCNMLVYTYSSIYVQSEFTIQLFLDILFWQLIKLSKLSLLTDILSIIFFRTCKEICCYRMKNVLLCRSQTISKYNWFVLHFCDCFSHDTIREVSILFTPDYKTFYKLTIYSSPLWNCIMSIRVFIYMYLYIYQFILLHMTLFLNYQNKSTDV